MDAKEMYQPISGNLLRQLLMNRVKEQIDMARHSIKMLKHIDKKWGEKDLDMDKTFFRHQEYAAGDRRINEALDLLETIIGIDPDRDAFVNLPTKRAIEPAKDLGKDHVEATITEALEQCKALSREMSELA
jgi:hypothetical protein